MSRRIRALHDYAPTGEGQVAMKASVTYELLDDSGPWWTVRSDMGEQGIVPSNYVEVVAGLPPAPLPQAPPGYAPQAAVPYGAPQQLGMPQQQVPMQQQMPMVANTNANTNTTVVNIQGAVAGPAFVNPGGAQCHHIWGLVNIFCLQGWFCGIAAMLSACNASSATTDAQYQASIASARCCNIAGSCVGVVTLIIIIVVAVLVGGTAVSMATSSSSCTFNGFACNNDDWY